MGLPGVHAQGLADLTSSGIDPTFTRLFGGFQAFSADATVQVYDQNESEVVSTEMKFAVKNGNIRMELDLSKLKSKDLPAGAAESLKQLGMDKVISLMLLEKTNSYIIYPGMQATLRMPMEESDIKTAAASTKLDRQAVGTEMLEGHPCTKYRVTLTDAAGQKQEAFTWNASDLKGFPVQIQTSDGEHMIILRFRNPSMGAPSQTLFSVPSGYTEYDSQQALLQAVMMKALGGLGGLGGE